MVEFISADIPFPKTTTEDYLTQATADILAILDKPNKINLPLMQYGDSTKNAVIEISKLLGSASEQPTLKEQAMQQPTQNQTRSHIYSKPSSSSQIIKPVIKPMMQLPRVHTGVTSTHNLHQLPYQYFNNIQIPINWTAQHALQHITNENIKHNAINHVYNDSGKRLINRPGYQRRTLRQMENLTLQ